MMTFSQPSRDTCPRALHQNSNLCGRTLPQDLPSILAQAPLIPRCSPPNLCLVMNQPRRLYTNRPPVRDYTTMYQRRRCQVLTRNYGLIYHILWSSKAKLQKCMSIWKMSACGLHEVTMDQLSLSAAQRQAP